MFAFLAVLGMEPRAFYMLGKHSTIGYCHPTLTPHNIL
jgi:hypothetical protein